MRPVLAAFCCLLLQAPAWGYSVTMPTDVPVTITVDKPTAGGRGGGGSPREPREPREYSSPSASSADPSEALAVLAAIVAAPVVIVGGALYLAGKSFANWLDERRLERERAERDAAARQALREKDAREMAAAIAMLGRREDEGRAAEWTRVGVLLDALASSAEAAETGTGAFPYDGLALETSVPGKKYARQNDFNADILAAYRELWRDASYRELLSIVGPDRYKGMIAWESEFDPEVRKVCGNLVRRCLYNAKTKKWKNANKQGVGLLSMVPRNAADKDGAALVVSKDNDERLDSAKSIRGGLRSLRLVRTKLLDIYVKHKTAPSDEAMREFVMVGHNTGWYAMRQALDRAPAEYKKPLADIRLADLMRPRGDKKPLLAEIVDSKGQPKKFESETKRYLVNIDKWIEAAKPKPKPEEKKP